jgi:CBS domain-containing protein
MKARDLMTLNPRVVTSDQPVSHAAEIMRDRDTGVVPVVDGFSLRLRGVITERDIVTRCTAANHLPTCPVADHMTTAPLATVSPDADVHEVLALMERVRRVMVIEGGRLVGIIARADLSRYGMPAMPAEVEQLLERISEPAHTLVHA